MNRLIRIFCIMVLASPMAGQSQVRIALAQIQCINSDREGNFRRIEYALMDAKALGAQLVCFPETSIYGWVNPEAHAMASPIPGADSRVLSRLARAYQLHICIGICEKEGEKLYDAAILMNPEGDILLKHRKINILEELMDPPYTSGRGVQVVDTELGRIGVLICADSFKPEILNQMNELNPDLLLIPYGWANTKDKWPAHGESLKSTITQVAKSIGCTVIGTDALGSITHGPWNGMVFGGQSYAIDSSGSVLAKGRDRERDILVIDVVIGNSK